MFVILSVLHVILIQKLQRDRSGDIFNKINGHDLKNYENKAQVEMFL